MKKLFLTSGIILCMACPAIAANDITSGGMDATNTSVEADCSYTYLDDYDGPVNFEAKWKAICYAGGVNLDSAKYSSASGNALLRSAKTPASPATVYVKYDDGMYSSYINNACTTPVSTITTPTLDGYTFAGYYNTKANASAVTTPAAENLMIDNNGTITNSGKQQSSLSNVAGTPSVWYARWTANSYNVYYTAGTNGTGSSTDTNGATFDSSYTIKGMGTSSGQSGVTPNTGYHFVKWTGSSTDTNYSSPVNGYSETETISQYTVVGHLTLTAQFAPDINQISYATGTAGTRTTGFSGTMADTDATYDSSVTLRTNAFSIYGYEFAGWTSTVNLASGVTEAATYTNGQTINPYKVADDVTLTATWKPLHYKVIYDPGAHGTGGTTDSYNSVSGTGGATYDANYTALTQSAASVTANTGYTFRGWNTASGQTTPNWTGENPWTRTSDLRVYAAYTANKTTVSYNCGKSISNPAVNGTWTNPAGWTGASQTVTYDSAASHPAGASVCSLNGYTFARWICVTGTTGSTTGGLTGDGITNGNWAVDATNVTCTAVWTQNTINLNWYNDSVANGGTQITLPQGSNAGSCNYDGALHLPPMPEKAGYTFDGWTVRPATTGQ